MAQVKLVNRTKLTFYLRVKRPLGKYASTTVLLMPRAEMTLSEGEVTPDIQARVKNGEIRLIPLS